MLMFLHYLYIRPVDDWSIQLKRWQGFPSLSWLVSENPIFHLKLTLIELGALCPINLLGSSLAQ